MRFTENLQRPGPKKHIGGGSEFGACRNSGQPGQGRVITVKEELTDFRSRKGKQHSLQITTGATDKKEKRLR